MTGAPVASYYGSLRFSALLTEWIREGRPHCLAPNGNSLQVLSNLLVSDLRICKSSLALLFWYVNRFWKIFGNFFDKKSRQSLRYHPQFIGVWKHYEFKWNNFLMKSCNARCNPSKTRMKSSAIASDEIKSAHLYPCEAGFHPPTWIYPAECGFSWKKDLQLQALFSCV